MTGTSARMRAVAVSLLYVFLVACSSQPKRVPAPDPGTVLQAIPAADPAQVERIHDMKNWRNPYLIVRADGVALFDVADSAEIRLKPEELLPALAALPASNWPYGRVVAATENSAKAAEQDGAAIRRNRGIVGGMLEGAHIAVKWVPSA
jgi:hypothetical protein